MYFCAVFNYILQPTEKPSDVISGRLVGPIVPDKGEEFCDPHLNISR